MHDLRYHNCIAQATMFECWNVDTGFVQIGPIFLQINKSARNIFHTNIGASIYFQKKLSFLGEKWRDEVVDHKTDLNFKKNGRPQTHQITPVHLLLHCIPMHTPYTLTRHTLCLTLRLDRMSHTVDCIFQASYH